MGHDGQRTPVSWDINIEYVVIELYNIPGPKASGGFRKRAILDCPDQEHK
jgi:hypothetical protein